MTIFRKNLEVQSDTVSYTETHITAKYDYRSTKIKIKDDGALVATPETTAYEFKTDRRVPKLGVMLVGLGGNNGTTVAAGLLANKHKISWQTKDGIKEPNFYGSLTQASTVRVGNIDGEEAYVPFTGLLPMVKPENIVLGGWDLSSCNLADAMTRAKVVDFDLQTKLRPYMQEVVPMKAAYDPNFIANNQAERADHVISGSKQEQLDQIRSDIRAFKQQHGLHKIVVLWSANTEKLSIIEEGVNDTKENLFRSIEKSSSRIAPSTLYAVASILEGVPYINGSPQNTFVPGVVELAMERNCIIGGDDFKSGQTKVKSVIVDYLIGAGIKTKSIASYNHLGNNDGKNLDDASCFRSKEISKSDVVNDIVASNPLLYAEGERPDHCIVIKYIENVGDSKRAMDEYSSEIFLGGTNTIAMYNTCEDSLLAAPLMLDLVILTELITRIELRKGGEDFHGFHPIAALLSYLTKAPLVPEGTPVVNALTKQRAMLENIFRACVGLQPENNMLLEFK